MYTFNLRLEMLRFWKYMILFGQSELSSLKYTPVVLVWLDKRNYEPKEKKLTI